MSVKSMNVYVELDIQAVTCPGVWLCPNGKIALKIFMFETSARTSHLPPVFPLLYHQKFIFQKTFSNVRYLADLQHLFGKEFLYTELVQCSGSTGVVLASFETTVFELLYPSPCVKGLIAGVDVDLLMEPTSCFPGILAPKIEISTKTVIEESIDSPSHSKRNPGIINPKMLSSKGSPTFKRCQQKRMCNVKEELSRSPKQKRKSVQSKRRHIKQKGGVCTVVPNSDENSNSCVCCSSNAQGISLQQSKSAESVLKSPTCLPVWTSATRRIHSQRSYCNLLNDLEQDDQAKWRKTKRDCHCMKYDCPCQGENGSHKACSCPVCSTYNVYFGRQFVNQCCVQGKRPQKCPGNCCHCGSEKNRLAEAVHERVQKSLHLSPYLPFKRDIDDMITKCPCNISEQKQISNCGKSQYREEFYRDLEKFYKELHKRAKKKTSKDDCLEILRL
ncbi:uncharacterized protein [Periplaneta americana]|uniref:uncharacterized protein isoform X2 n=1 Tax=Periplaneta americana TaxID=6978 RepID=UPI0037E87D78